jgi:hypothetical protein
MLKLKQQSVFAGAACVLLALFGVVPSYAAQNHVVSPAELQRAAVAASSSRQHDVATLRQFLSSPKAEEALQSAHINPTQVKTAISALSDDEVAQLASRANKAQADFAAGGMGERGLILVLIAIMVVILIIVAAR